VSQAEAREGRVTETMIDASGVELCAEAFGDPADPPLLLIMGMGASMLWWDEGFCRLLAGGGRFVIRYDHRDTGRSVTFTPGAPGYSGADLVADAAGVLDGYGIDAAHVVGVSMGGGIAQELALDFPERVSSLTLISTTAVGPGERNLPPVAEEYARFIEGSEVDWSDPDSVVEYVVADWRALNGRQRRFDESRIRELAVRDVKRARNFASVQNHALLAGEEGTSRSITSISVPTLVIHGTADPLFPFEHGQALAEEIPGARLLPLEGAGHGVDPADWDLIAPAILEHTTHTERSAA
jgi:pimeloyl-ACP methyl ester carboxylesterase